MVKMLQAGDRGNPEGQGDTAPAGHLVGNRLLDTEPGYLSGRTRHTRYWRGWSSDVCSSDLQDVLRALSTEAALALGADSAGVYLVDGGHAVGTVGHGVPEDWAGVRIERGVGAAGQVLATGGRKSVVEGKSSALGCRRII